MKKTEKSGFIYVLTNKSFHRDNWIKIGYAEDVDKRARELSNTALPLPYEVYCTYEIPRIRGNKDPDKLLHNLINKLNPDLRISQNREFFEMFPWDAYEMLFAIAQMHGKTDKLRRNEENLSGQNDQNDSEYSVELLFPSNSDNRNLYDKFKNVILSLDSSLEETPTQNYVAFKKGKSNIVCLWPKSNWIEIVLNAKVGQINDKNDMVYDISNRKWSSEQYAFKFFDDTDVDATKDLIQQVLDLKK
ncbi:GIY-YIG nuclease family protein [bacterium]|nr:GIY-YIG nuclease family protein [bacterium]